MQEQTGMTHIALDPDVATRFSAANKPVQEVYVKAENPFDFRNPEHLNWLNNEIKNSDILDKYNKETLGLMNFNDPNALYSNSPNYNKPLSYDYHVDLNELLGALEDGAYQAYEIPVISNLIRSKGHDAIYMAEDLESHRPPNLAVFNPHQIKSATKNQGTYSPDNPDIYKAEGGLVDSAPEEAIKNTVTDPQAYKMLDMDLANLALMNQQMQPPRHMAEGGFLNDIYNNVIPAHARTYAESMLGNRSPINENNFSSSELDMMRDAIASSRRDRTITNQRLYQEQLAAAKNDKERMNVVSQGPSTKIDQTVGYQHYPNSGDQSTRDDNNFGYDSAVRNTLGRFAYEKDANGNLIATDTYKFRDDLPGQTRPSSDYAKMSTFEKLKTLYDDSSKDKAGVGTLLSRMGSAFMGADSRPVNVNLGKAPFAHGGAARHPSPEEMRIEMIERRYAKA